MSAKGEYMVLLEMGELLEMYPELSGSWVQDKEVFTPMWEANKDAFKELNVDYDEIDPEH